MVPVSMVPVSAMPTQPSSVMPSSVMPSPWHRPAERGGQAGESRLRAGSAPQRERPGAERACWAYVRTHLRALAVQKRGLAAGRSGWPCPPAQGRSAMRSVPWLQAMRATQLSYEGSARAFERSRTHLRPLAGQRGPINLVRLAATRASARRARGRKKPSHLIHVTHRAITVGRGV